MGLFSPEALSYTQAGRAIPVVLAWSGEVVFDGFGSPQNYEETGEALRSALVGDAHSLVACVHGGTRVPSSISTEMFTLLSALRWDDPPPKFTEDVALPNGCTLY